MLISATAKSSCITWRTVLLCKQGFPRLSTDLNNAQTATFEFMNRLPEKDLLQKMGGMPAGKIYELKTISR